MNIWTGLRRKIKIEKFRRALAKALWIRSIFFDFGSSRSLKNCTSG